MSAPHDPWKDARQWAEQGLRNARVIASTKTGQERIGWLEDVQYWQSLVDALVSQAETIRQGAAEIATLRATVAADDERLRAAGALVGVEFGCDTADWMAERILELRATVDQQQARITALEAALIGAGVLAQEVLASRQNVGNYLRQLAQSVLNDLSTTENIPQPIQRFDLVSVSFAYTSDHEMQRSDDGEWVRFDDVFPPAALSPVEPTVHNDLCSWCLTQADHVANSTAK